MGDEEKKHWLEPPEWWKKVKPLRWAALAVIAFAVISVTWTVKVVVAPSKHAESERFTAMAADPVLLTAGLKSYDNLDAVRAALDADKVSYAVTQNHAPPSSKYPPHDRDTVVADKYQHFGVEGRLTLEFFNDRLYKVLFNPADPVAYADKLHANDKRVKKDRLGRAEQHLGNLRIATNVDFAVTDVGKNLQTAAFVIWEDTRLSSDLDEWDRRFVALPSGKK
jgi:hypothetical protein